MDRGIIIAEAAGRLSLNTGASPTYALNFVIGLVEAIERLHTTPLTAEDLKVISQPKPIKLNEFHSAVLQHLLEDDEREYYSSLDVIADNLNMPKNRVRLACRSLKRKGLAKQVPFHDDEGFIRGSGYGITPLGKTFARQTPFDEQEQSEGGAA